MQHGDAGVRPLLPSVKTAPAALFSSAPNVGGEPEFASELTDFIVVVALVETYNIDVILLG